VKPPASPGKLPEPQMTLRLHPLRLSAFIGTLALASGGCLSDPADGAGTDDASGGSATGTGGSASGGQSSASGGAGGAGSGQVGPCDFEDEVLAQSVRETLTLFYLSEDQVDELESLSLGGDVSSLEGISCLTGLLELSLLSDEVEPALDLAPLAGVTSLRSLHLFGGDFENVEVVPSLPLTHLQLSGMDWTSLDALEGADTVEVMWIEEMPATDLSSLSSLSSLWSLTVTNTDTTDLSPLASMESLESLHVAGAPVQDLPGLGQLESLNSIALFDTSIASLEGLAGAPALVRIDIEPATGLESLAGLEGLPSLLHVNIAASSLSDLSALADCPALESLELLRGHVVDLSHLASCESLTRVVLTSNRIVDLAPLAALNLEQLSVAHNQIVDLSPLSGAALGTLDVSGNPLGSLDPIGTLEGLTSLSISDVGATSLDFLAGFELTALDASTNQIDDVTVLLGMPLHDLDLTDNEIPTLPSEFEGASGECSVTQLEQNPLDAPSKALLATLCDTDEQASYVWDGGGCDHCYITK